MTLYLKLDDLLALIEFQRLGPIRDMGLLESAAHRPGASVFGRDAYPTIHLKAAALLESLVRNHPLVDGNKRLGWLATSVFYRCNHLWLRAPEDDAYDLVIATATGELELDQIAAALAGWVRTEAPDS